MVWTRPDLAGKQIEGTVMVIGVGRDETGKKGRDFGWPARK
jgi:hypothetical protein